MLCNSHLSLTTISDTKHFHRWGSWNLEELINFVLRSAGWNEWRDVVTRLLPFPAFRSPHVALQKYRWAINNRLWGKNEQEKRTIVSKVNISTILIQKQSAVDWIVSPSFCMLKLWTSVWHYSEVGFLGSNPGGMRSYGGPYSPRIVLLQQEAREGFPLSLAAQEAQRDCS